MAEHRNTEDGGAERPVWANLGGGLITGAADDDPGGIATYSQVGAAFGYGMLWCVLLTTPLMIAIQAISAGLGRVTGEGLFASLRRCYPRPLVLGLMACVTIANVINLGADLGAMGAALRLLAGGPALLYAAAFALLSLLLQVFIPFTRYSPILKLLTASLFAYVATVLVIDVPWAAVLRSVIVPDVRWNSAYSVGLVAMLGTTISPYLFCWQAAEEVEEIGSNPQRRSLRAAPMQAPSALRRIGIDTTVGMVFSNAIAFFIILTAAVVLHAHGRTDIQSSSEAAEALRPLAGDVAFGLFAAGIIGTGLLAVPVLAGATAYAVSDALGRRAGLELAPRQAPFFYAVLVASMLLGVLLDLAPIDPIRALYWSAVVNGVTAVPMMVAMMRMASRRDVMGGFTLPWPLAAAGWVATGVMLAAVAGMAFAWWM